MSSLSGPFAGQFAKRDTYTGGWMDGLFHGQGTYTTASRDVFTGEFVKGKKDGPMTVIFVSIAIWIPISSKNMRSITV